LCPQLRHLSNADGFAVGLDLQLENRQVAAGNEQAMNGNEQAVKTG
jgi:hypothetical protein